MEAIVAWQLGVQEEAADRRQTFGEIQEEISIQIERQVVSWHRPKDDCTEVGDKSTGTMG
jgi:hypothetical protein